jgi:acetolactate synthase-1/3 small subunit
LLLSVILLGYFPGLLRQVIALAMKLSEHEVESSCNCHPNVMRHIISIILQNEAGALARVAALFSSRGYNIESLSVATTEHTELSRLTLVTRGSDDVIEQITKQLAKLVDVVKIADMTLDDHIERELLLIKIKVDQGKNQRISELIEANDVRVLDNSPGNFTLEMTGANELIDEFIEAVRDCAEILAVVRSGAMAISRGEKVLRNR